VHSRKNGLHALCFAVLAALGLSGCGGVSGLNGSEGEHAFGAIQVTRGQVGDFTGFLVNNSGATVTLVSAEILPFNGFPTPKLSDSGVETSLGFVGSGRGWPQRDARVKVVTLHGFKLRSGHRAQILYAVAGSRIGLDYAARGVEVGIREGSSTAKVKVLSPGAICVVRTLKTACPTGFVHRFTRAASRLS